MKFTVLNRRGVQFNPDKGNIKIWTPLQCGQEIHFDIAVTATEGTKSKGGVGILVGSIGLGSQGQTDKEKSSVSRISVDVPILLPIQIS